jgi:hypothetical protein
MDVANTPPLLNRKQAAEFLAKSGFPITRRYFEKLCTPGEGQGPREACRFGPKVLYRPDDIIAWAHSRCVIQDNVSVCT